MPSDTTNQYLRTKVLTASPAELRMLLIEGAIRFTRQGRDGLAHRDYEMAFEGLTNAKAILLELINALSPEVDPELCERLSALYTYMYKRLIEANLEKNTDMIDEVLQLLEYERETWSMLLDQLASEKRAGGADARPSAPDSPPAYTPLSVEG